jgi:glycerol-3-phosphate dehydrogenase
VFPGGAIADFDTFLAQVRATWPFLGAGRSERMARAYGAALGEMLEGVGDEAAMGRLFGAGLTEVELAWMRTREWARTAADALDRRSKLGLHMSDGERAAVGEWFAAQAVSRAC